MPARNGTRERVHMPRCAIAGVEATIAETARAFPRHSHDRFGVGLIVSGGHKSASGRGPVEARMNDVITVNPGEVHDGSPLDERGRAWHMLYFEPSMLTGGGPGNATTFLSQYLTQKAVGQFDLGPAAAFSIVYFLIILLFCFVLYNWMQRMGTQEKEGVE